MSRSPSTAARLSLPAWVRQRADPAARFGLRITLFALAVTLVAIPFGYLLEQVTTHGSLVRLDTAWARALHDQVVGHPALIRLLEGVSFIGSPVWFYVLVPAVALFCYRQRRIRLVVYLVVTGLVGGAIDTAVKLAVHRSRPDLHDPIVTAHGKSFPSGHTMTSTYAYGAILLTLLPFVARRWRPVAIAAYAGVVAAVGFSRLALGVHFLSDVLGGIVLGLAWLAASTAAFSIWRVERGRPPVDVTEGVEPEAADAA
jgi:undecaprenyl-diphosphatase